MEVFKLVTIAWLFIFETEGREGIDKFLISFVENERKPTMVVFNGICWENSLTVHVMKELSKADIRSSAVMSRGTSLQDQAVLFVTDLDCPGTVEVFEDAPRLGLHRLPYRWLALSSAPLRAAAPLWDPFLVDSDLVVAVAEERGYRMTEIHKPAPDHPTILTPRGVFHEALTDVRSHRELFRRRRDIMGAPLTMDNVILDSNSSKYHLLQETSLELQHDLISKNGWTLAKLGFLALNATPKAIFSNKFGHFENGEWTGVIKDLIEYKADMATNFGMNKTCLEELIYVDTMDNSRARFVYRQPVLSRVSNVFSLPFSPGVWIATVISSFVGCLAFYLSTKVIGEPSGCEGVMADAFLLAMGAVSQQGCDIQPRNISSRLVLWVTFASLMALYAAYSANIMVLMRAPSSSITNLPQLAKSKLTLAANDVDYNHLVFKGSSDPDPVRNAISKKVEPNNGPKAFLNLTEGVARIQKDMFAFHSLVEPVYRQIEKTFQEPEKCDLMEVDYVGYAGYHAPASKRSPYLELLKVIFKRLREVGLKSAVNFRFEVRKPPCKDSGAMFSSVGLVELRPVLIFMSYGVALSLAVLAGEHFIYHAYRYHLQKRQLAQDLLANY